jgi:hypothetical protein
MLLIVSRYFTPKGYSGITIFPFVFIREKLQRNNQVLMNHERIHIRQQAELAVVPFFIWYGLEFLIRWIQTGNKAYAYRNISFEREAYAKEGDITYLKKRPIWKFLRYL